jgi:predicted PurR-regulated permease PerM
MTPPEPPNESVPTPISDKSAPVSAPVSTPGTGPGGWRSKVPLINPTLTRFLSNWGLPLFVVFILIVGRDVLLPFVFAALIAYILAPVVTWMAERKNGTMRMPRGLAIIFCYIVFIAAMTGFMFLLVPRLSKDIARIGKEAPAMYKRINEEWTPGLARWIEKRFPSLAPPKREAEGPLVPDVPLPPGTAFTMTPLPDGRMALSLTPGGVDIKPLPGGVFHIETNEAPPEPLTVEEKLRSWVAKGLSGMQSKSNDLVKATQALVAGLIKGIFTFFLTLMIGAFILIDREKLHSFLRSLFPPSFREDYDEIIRDIDKGLSGVIRGQLLICLVNGIFTYIGLIIFDVKYTLILSVVAGVMSLIPIFGSILSSVPIVLVALVSGDSGLDIFRGVAMILWIVGIHFIEANLLNPKIIGTAAKIHPVLVIFSLVLGEHEFGLVGALLAVPVLSAVQVIFLFLYKNRWNVPPGGRGGSTTTGPTQTVPPPLGDTPRAAGG